MQGTSSENYERLSGQNIYFPRSDEFTIKELNRSKSGNNSSSGSFYDCLLHYTLSAPSHRCRCFCFYFVSFFQIPFTKAKVLEPNDETSNKDPRVACDLCKSTYNLKTGDKLAAAGASGLLGGLAKAVLSSQDTGNLDTYQLGEKNGKIMFTMEGM